MPLDRLRRRLGSGGIAKKDFELDRSRHNSDMTIVCQVIDFNLLFVHVFSKLLYYFLIVSAIVKILVIFVD